ncbi:hypothetical protein MUU74_02475 [Chryseobacterium daecheongense]|uniref:hypothetical protein n=1 Tax=Chryseobacterium daecheongense TaxID=192389 RepID=UPI001FD6FF20|nr:hypothetical protein [Chryseobacterium daecheongense]UOU98824.1 hypothetical protein MUU74_02475 [Chryseobacterium daecheongense]
MKTKPTLESGTLDPIISLSTIPATLIQTLVDNYRNSQLATINTHLNMNDAHSIWFNLATLKKFIADIESETQKVNPDVSENDLGIRFYYAAYPSVENWDLMENQPIGQNYAGKHTLVLVPTMKQANEQGELLDYDFNPLNSGAYQKNNAVLSLAMESDDAPLSDDEALAQNHGQLIPPSSTVVQMY